MINATNVRMLEAESALLVGVVTADGEPLACRAWGVRVEVLTDTSATMRVLLSDDDLATSRITVGSTIAVTGADVSTFRSIQVKGSIAAVEAPTDADRQIADNYIEAYFGAISRGDATERMLLDRMAPHAIVALTVEVDAAYDQTPGPTAGTTLAAGVVR